MAEIQIKAGNSIFEKDTPLSTLCLIIEGEVSFFLPMGEIVLKEGDAIGLINMLDGTHTYQYTARTDVVVDFTPFKQLPSFCADLASSPEEAKQFLSATLKQIRHIRDTYFYKKDECDLLYSSVMQYYTDYTRFCKQYDIVPKVLPGFEDVQPLLLEQNFEDYIDGYYRDMQQMTEDPVFAAFLGKEGILSGFFVHAINDMQTILNSYEGIEQYLSGIADLLINEAEVDFLDLYITLLTDVDKKNGETEPLLTAIGKLFLRANHFSTVDKALYQQRYKQYQALVRKSQAKAEANNEQNRVAISAAPPLTVNSLAQILEYAGVTDEFRLQFTKAVNDYKNEPEKTADTDKLLQLRRLLTSSFLDLYAQVFLTSMQRPDMPVPVKLFLYFGYVDEQLCGYENTAQLMDSVDILSGGEQNVYPFYDWLKLIYRGEKEPHKDEFERNYPAYVKSLETDGSISKEDAKQMLGNAEEKIRFEIKNMMASGLKMTFGRPASYCPVLSEHNFMKPASACLLDGTQIMKALEDLLAVDYSAYHREVMFTDSKAGVGREMIQKRILPQFILLPGIGMQGGLWQEIDGFNRQSPASMLLPVFCLADINMLLLRLTGEFRWEMCKRMQGARWNDITYPSLTSQYNDYIQFYKRNNELSADAKQKIKQQLTKVRNRFKECFLIDYMAWILYESKGSPRLNKVARPIFVAYCPFPSATREELIKNPLYSKTMERIENQKNKELGRINNVILRVRRNNDGYCPQELLDQADFLKQ